MFFKVFFSFQSPFLINFVFINSTLCNSYFTILKILENLKNFLFTYFVLCAEKMFSLLSLHWSTFTWRMIALCRVRLALEKSARVCFCFHLISQNGLCIVFRSGWKWDGARRRFSRSPAQARRVIEVKLIRKRGEFSDLFSSLSFSLGKNDRKFVFLHHDVDVEFS